MTPLFCPVPVQVTVKEFKDKFLRKPYIINLMEELTLKGITQVRCRGVRWRADRRLRVQGPGLGAPSRITAHRGTGHGSGATAGFDLLLRQWVHAVSCFTLAYITLQLNNRWLACPCGLQPA